MSADADVLYAAMMSAAVVLHAAVGQSVDDRPDDEVIGTGPRTGASVERDQVPEMAWRAAATAFEFLLAGAATMDPTCPPLAEDLDLAASRLLNPAREA